MHVEFERPRLIGQESPADRQVSWEQERLESEEDGDPLAEDPAPGDPDVQGRGRERGAHMVDFPSKS